MQFSEAWLRTLVNPALDTAQLAHALTMAGLEVEALEPAAAAFERVVVAEILSAEKHPDADRLRVCRVDVGEAEPVTIVCGAPNAAAGLRVPCARPGAKLPGIEIKVAKVRGVESFGMLCSTKELGIAGDASGLMLLPPDAPVGANLREYLNLDDTLITLKLTPNRADCLSMTGLAREVGALSGAAVAMPAWIDAPVAIADTCEVTVAAADACPLYLGRVVRGVNARAQTPRWMVERLERCGVRPLSAPVDVTNYVLLELGQPMHAFALDRLAGGIRIRLAQAGEQLVLLNGQSVELAPDMLVVADASGPVALAGIMGGEPTSVTDLTTDILLEAAFFAPVAIAGRARRLGLATDSSHRFERGVDYANTHRAMERATQLLIEICGGAAGPVVEVASALPARPPIALRHARLRRIAGVDIPQATLVQQFGALGCDVSIVGDGLSVIPPSFRFDLEIEEDLIEEAVRLFGYDNIPALAPATPSKMLPSDESRQGEDPLKRAFAAQDFQEVVTYSFVDPAIEALIGGAVQPLELANPIASQMAVMRTSLFGGLIETLRYNLNRQQERVRIFEVGSVYLGAGADAQPGRIAGLVYGAALPEQWGTDARRVDFFDLKGSLERALARPLPTRAASHPALHPGQCAEVVLGGAAIGVMGALHPRLVQAFGLNSAPLLFELDAAAVAARAVARYRHLSRFPSVRRDLAFVVDQATPAGSLRAAMLEAAPELVCEVELFDDYRGKGMAENQKSLAFRIVMQDTQRTLTDEEVEGAVAVLTRTVVERFNASLRA